MLYGATWGCRGKEGGGGGGGGWCLEEVWYEEFCILSDRIKSPKDEENSITKEE
jgi:hypothetical protein